jgi:hypothetical protein
MLALTVLCQRPQDWDVRKRVIGAGGIDMAIAAMVAHPSAVEVQISGAACLTTLAHADAEAKAEITGRGGIQVLVAAMERAAQVRCAQPDSACLSSTNRHPVSLLAGQQIHPSIARYLRVCGGASVMVDSLLSWKLASSRVRLASRWRWQSALR